MYRNIFTVLYFHTSSYINIYASEQSVSQTPPQYIELYLILILLVLLFYMQGPESTLEEPEIPAFLSLKESVRLSMSRKRVQSARQFDAQVNDCRAQQLISPPAVDRCTDREKKITPAEEMKYSRRLDEAFLCTNEVATAPKQLTEDEMADVQVDKEMDRNADWKAAHDGIQEITISSYAHFIDVISNFKDLYNEITQRYNTKLVFKGITSKYSGLMSSLLSANTEKCQDAIRSIEAAWIRGFLDDPPKNLTFSAEPSYSSNVWALLSLMHRCDYPTRLVEWTFNPNVALYFAVENEFDQDGEIWFVSPTELYKNQHHGFSDELGKLHLHFPSVQQQQDVVSSLTCINADGDLVKELEGFDALTSGRDTCLSFLEPPHFDKCMLNQACVYSVASDPTMEVADILRNSHFCCRRLIIPSFLKAVLLQSLNLVNINSRWLFPSGQRKESREQSRGFLPAHSPQEIAALFEERYQSERNKRKREILAQWSIEREARMKKHNEKAWPFDGSTSKSYRGVLCKKKFIDVGQNSFSTGDNSFIDLGSAASGTTITVYNNQGSRRQSRRQSMETVTIVTISETDGNSVLEDASVAEEDAQHAEPILVATGPEVHSVIDDQTTGIAFSARTESKQGSKKMGALGRVMRDTLNLVSSPLRGMHHFVKNYGSPSKYTISSQEKAEQSHQANEIAPVRTNDPTKSFSKDITNTPCDENGAIMHCDFSITPHDSIHTGNYEVSSKFLGGSCSIDIEVEISVSSSHSKED